MNPRPDTLPEQLHRLWDLAQNLWWTWHPSARSLFRDLDRTLWQHTRFNPVALLRRVDRGRLLARAGDRPYLDRLVEVDAHFQRDIEAPPEARAVESGLGPEAPVAYFCAEFGLHSSVPIYSGGLGVLAGDHCREASDLRLPLIGVGLLYERGYFRQRITPEGLQDAMPNKFSAEDLPLARLRRDGGDAWLVQVPVNGRDVKVAAWEARLGRTRLLLLDTDLAENDEEDRTLTSQLYGGDGALRLRQEVVLGIGGVRVLAALGVAPRVWHMNEGHTALLVAERLARRVRTGEGSAAALEAVKAATVFTTHTPVAAGHDHFPEALVKEVLEGWAAETGLDLDRVMAISSLPDAAAPELNMTVLALRGSRTANGVSRRHGEVARRMWKVLWPERGEKHVPIGAVTNGVHVPFWMCPELRVLLEQVLQIRADASLGDLDWDRVQEVPDDALWEIHRGRKRRLLALLRERVRLSWRDGEVHAAQIAAAGGLLDPGALTIGFARRFAAYKRADLILRDLDRLRRLLCDPWRPVQIVFAGKAHPADRAGKELMQVVYQKAMDPSLEGRIVFAEDYDMQLAAHMVSGVDLWLNNPIPPLEASGTSGVKASLNGVPQLSTPDGWWLEGFEGDNGWMIGKEDHTGSSGARGADLDRSRDEQDAADLYRVLEEEVIPLFYERDWKGVPHGWVAVMKRAIRTAGSRFSARRMLLDYLDNAYLPAARGDGP